MPGAYQTLDASAALNVRPLGNTEQNWCRAVVSGTGITVLAIQMTKSPSEISVMSEVLQKLQKSHPLLRSKLRYDSAAKAFSFLMASESRSVPIEIHDARLTAQILSDDRTPGFSPIRAIVERELNGDTWSDPNSFPSNGVDVFTARVYTLSDANCVVTLRFHTSVCDRTTAVELLRELMELVDGGAKLEIKNEGEGKIGIEGLIPNGLGKKTLWSHGMDMLGYSLSSFRLSNLKFMSTKSPRHSEVIRLQIDVSHTAMILAGCKSRGIKLCGVLSAAALLAAHSIKLNSDKQQAKKKKYGVVTLIDCRSVLDPPLSVHHFGFYHTAILNSHTIKGTEPLWELAAACHAAMADYKKHGRHFSDMGDLNFLMSKAIENPSLTPSSSLRTALISVFEEPVIDNSRQVQERIGVEDYVGCASAHGIGPSIGMFDTVRDGALDCACVYPAPLHSREQMGELVHHMKRLIMDAAF